MSGNDKIVEAILNDANIYADKVNTKAVQLSQETINATQREADNLLSSKTSEANKEANDIVNNKMTLARLDVNKLKLGAKREILDSVYSQTVDILKKLSSKDYLNLVEKILIANADKGELVLLSSKASIGVKDVQGLDVVAKKNLQVESSDAFDSGVILKKDGYEKEFTFDVLVEELRLETETEVSTKLF